jgi:NAD(P)H-dependent FMN reductase
MAALNVLSICGSLRKGSFNAMVQRLLRRSRRTA